jgi:hypothetical protein
MLQIPVIQWPFKDGNKVQVWAKTVPDHAERMRIIGNATRVAYVQLKAKE